MSTVYVYTDFGGPETQQLLDRPAPQPGPGELAVEVRAAGVNPVDWKIKEFGMFVQHYPFISGTDASGIIEEVGSEVTNWAKGDKMSVLLVLIPIPR